MVELSIIIVNYRTPKLVVDCLNSIYRFPSSANYEIMVVDNLSADESEKEIRTKFPTVRWIQMSYNAGFARANNAAIKQANGNIVLLLNSDTLVENDAIANCVHSFKNSKYLACGVQLHNEDGSPQISGNYFMVGGLNNLLPLPYVGSLVKYLGQLVQVKKPNIPNSNQEMEVDWINGAFLMVKKDAIEQVGLMDEDFFLYAEEAEWCSRIQKVGKLVLYGQYKVIHLQGESSGVVFGASGKGYSNLFDRRGLQIMLSNFVRIRKQLGVLWFLFHFLVYFGTIPVFLVAGIVNILVQPRKAGTITSSFIGFVRNILIIARHIPLILFNRPHFYKVL